MGSITADEFRAAIADASARSAAAEQQLTTQNASIELHMVSGNREGPDLSPFTQAWLILMSLPCPCTLGPENTTIHGWTVLVPCCGLSK